MSLAFPIDRSLIEAPAAIGFGSKRQHGIRLGRLATERVGGASIRVSANEQRLQELIARALGGDEVAYAQFLADLSKLLRAFFRRKLHEADRAHAEDLVQESLIAVHLHRLSYDPNRPIGAWVYAIARYKLVDYFRRRSNPYQFVALDAVGDLFADETADAGDPSRDVAALLGSLPAKQSEAIRLVKLEQLTARDAAARLGVSEADVKISIHRGLKKLMALIAKGTSP